MYKFVLKRLLQLIPVIIGVTFIVFFIMNLAPGDPAAIILGDQATAEALAMKREELGLNDPLLVRYFNYMKNLLRGDMGTSYKNNIPVWNQVIDRLPNTAILAVAGIFIALLFGIPIGILSAKKQYSLLDNISMVAIRKTLVNGLYSKAKARKVSEEYIGKLKIKTPSGDQIVGNLSGGNQQKVVISKWLLNDPDIIIMDEPTRGIDVGAKRDIYLLIGSLVQEGKAVIIISSEIPELMGVCDRIVVMAEGHSSGELERNEFSQESIMRLASDIAV